MYPHSDPSGPDLPLVDPYRRPVTDPYGRPIGDRYAGPAGDPYAGPGGDPYRQQADDWYAGPGGAVGPAEAAQAGPPVPVKIVVSGGFGVGKTTFIGSLSEIEPLTTEAAMTSVAIDIDRPGSGQAKTTTTVAMDFGRVTLDGSIILYMFGTPGQDRFGFMWNELATGALGGVVLLDTSRPADSYVAMDYFERIGLPFVVAVNEFEGRARVPLDRVRAAANVDPGVPVVAVDARAREPVKRVILTLLQTLLSQARAAAGVS